MKLAESWALACNFLCGCVRFFISRLLHTFWHLCVRHFHSPAPHLWHLYLPRPLHFPLFLRMYTFFEMPSVFMPFAFAGLDVLWPQPQQSTPTGGHTASCQFAPSCCQASPHDCTGVKGRQEGDWMGGEKR